MEQVRNMTPAQYSQLVQAYAGQSGQDTGRIWSETVYSVLEQHLAALGVNRACPVCGSITAGIQRLHCQDCGKHFTRVTGTLLEKSRFPWPVWVEVLRMTLNDDSLADIKTVLEQDFGCAGINVKTVFAMRMKLIYAMASIEPPKLTDVIQMNESFVRESQKGQNLELISYVKGIERVARYGRKPSKLGTMGSEFDRLKQTYRLSLARVNELHFEIKLTIEKKINNVATKNLNAYMGFFTCRRNWRGSFSRQPERR